MSFTIDWVFSAVELIDKVVLAGVEGTDYEIGDTEEQSVPEPLG